MTDQPDAKIGRPTKFVPDTTNLIIQAIRAGNYVETAAAIAGISRQTIYDWLHQAQQPDATPELVAFSDAIRKARAEAEVRTVSAVQKGIQGGTLIKRASRTLPNGAVEVDEQWAPPDARAGLAFLKAAFPATWRDGVQAVELSGPGGGAIEVRQGGTLEERLAARIMAVRAEDARLELEDAMEGVVDAVVVEDEG